MSSSGSRNGNVTTMGPKPTKACGEYLISKRRVASISIEPVLIAIVNCRRQKVMLLQLCASISRTLTISDEMRSGSRPNILLQKMSSKPNPLHLQTARQCTSWAKSDHIIFLLLNQC